MTSTIPEHDPAPVGEVVDLDAARVRRTAIDPDSPGTAGDAVEAGGAESHFEVAFDEEPTPSVPVLPVPLPPVQTRSHGRTPIIPSDWSGLANIKATLRHHAGLTAYRAGFHAVRSPRYGVLAAFWATVGVFRLIGRQLRWWWVTEQYGLRQRAANDGDPMMWLRLHREVKHTRSLRGAVLAAEAVTVVIGAPVAVVTVPWWAQAAAAVAAVAGLAHLGRPIDRPILTPAVTKARFRRLNPDIVLRAFYAAGLGKPDKPDLAITFGSPMSRDSAGTGSRVVVELPYGKGFDDAVKARGAIASGLDVSVNQVFLTAERSSHRRVVLWVADRDPLAIPAGKTDLLDCKPRNIWRPVRFGRDERDRLVVISLLWISVLIGAQPRKGKTFAARLLALHAAADPYVKQIIVDGKNSPDWIRFRLVAHRMVFGTHPNPNDDDPITHLLAALDEVLAHIDRVNEILAGLPATVCPEGKLTEELARDPRYPDLRVWQLVMEEFQLYFETEDQDVNKQIAAKLSRIQAVGPSAGVSILSSSQKPSGVGAGDVGRLFNRYRDNHAVRFALKCGNRLVSEAVLGGDAYAEGFDASALPVGKEYLGVGYLYGLTDDTPAVRTFLADHPDAEKILTAARKHRQAVGTLSGAAAGEVVTRDVRDVLADVRAVLLPGETGASWERLAGRLAEAMPEHYADITPATVSAQLRDLGVPSVNVKEDGRVPKGARTAAIDAAITRRANA